MGKYIITDKQGYFQLFLMRKKWRVPTTCWQTPPPLSNFFGTNAWILYGYLNDNFALRSRKEWAISRSKKIRYNLWARGRK